MLNLGAKAGLRDRGRAGSARRSRSRHDEETHHVELCELADLLLACELVAQAIGRRVARSLLGKAGTAFGLELVLELRGVVHSSESASRQIARLGERGHERTSSSERVRAVRACSSVRT